MLSPGTLLQNRYRIKRELARGGMGAVYEAEAVHLGRAQVAVKETFFTEDWLREQFEREAATLARLRHSALPKVTDHFSEGTGQFLVMEFIPGQDLLALLKEQVNDHDAPFAWEQVCDWADKLLDALAYIHNQYPPVIHRDIKPQNLKLTPQGEIILLDFGLAKDATTPTRPGGSVRGYTAEYAPPEQLKFTGTDARSDLFALSATLYHLMTGQPPVSAKVREEMLGYSMPDPMRPAHQQQAQIPFGIAAVLARALALDRERRYPSAKEMRQALQQARQDIAAALLEEQRERERQVAERKRLEEERALAEQRRRDEEARQRALAEQRQRDEAARLAQERALAEQQQREAAARQAEERKLAEQRQRDEARQRQAQLAAEKQQREEEARRVAEAQRLVEARRCAALQTELEPEEATRPRPTPVPPPVPAPLPPKRSRRVAVAVGVLLLVLAAYVVWRMMQSAPEIEMVSINGGTFLMGSSDNEQGRYDGEDPHRVTVPSFAIGKYEITQAQWQTVMGTNPLDFKGADLPVETVSWEDAKAFCRKLSQLTGKQYRLPTEAEWEYACRAGTTGPYAGELDGMAWYSSNSGSKMHPVGQKRANAFGLYDMHGNVSEWCEDVYHKSYDGAPTDGSAWLSGGDWSSRVVRGGSWYYDSWLCRSANRLSNPPGNRLDALGFRVVLGSRTP